MNTKVTIQFSNGESREIVASDQLEAMIQRGEMFSAVSIHPDQLCEIEVSKMFVGNPVAALGQMQMYRNQMAGSGVECESLLLGIDHCMSFLANEITSHGSNMTSLRKH
jgi:hypothetical protein